MFTIVTVSSIVFIFLKKEKDIHVIFNIYLADYVY